MTILKFSSLMSSVSLQAIFWRICKKSKLMVWQFVFESCIGYKGMNDPGFLQWFGHSSSVRSLPLSRTLCLLAETLRKVCECSNALSPCWIKCIHNEEIDNHNEHDSFYFYSQYYIWTRQESTLTLDPEATAEGGKKRAIDCLTLGLSMLDYFSGACVKEGSAGYICDLYAFCHLGCSSLLVLLLNEIPKTSSNLYFSVAIVSASSYDP